MSGRIDIQPGTVFSLWKVLEFYGRQGNRRMYLCRCECGTEKPVAGQHLRRAASTSCGCDNAGPIKHGAAVTSDPLLRKAYTAWKNIKQRTDNPANEKYETYKGRRMSHDLSRDFSAFLAEVGLPPDKALSIDRIDNSIGYVRGNLRWATAREQAYNTKRTHNITYLGQTKPLKMWAEHLGISRAVLSARICRLGWSVDKALTTPTRAIRSRASDAAPESTQSTQSIT
jgi:hypothetical protein